MTEEKSATALLKEYCNENSIDLPRYTCGRQGSGDYFVKAQLYQINVQTFGKSPELAKSNADSNLLIKLLMLDNSLDKKVYDVDEELLNTELIKTFYDACSKRGNLKPNFKVTEMKTPDVNGAMFQVRCILGANETVASAMKIEEALDKATFKMVVNFPAE